MENRLERCIAEGGFEWLTGIEDTFITAPDAKTGRTLDEYEGYDGPGASTNLYERIVKTVVREEGVAVRAITYAMVPSDEGLPSRRYRDAILEGMLHHGLAKESIASLRDAATVPE